MTNAFQQKYPGEIAPDASMLTLLVQRFRDTGSKPIEKTVRLHKHHYGIHILFESDERYAWLQQDGSTCHTSRDSMEILTEFFDDRVISKGLWPPRLPDL
ncbi:uncharacterized protein TNCV_52071 [Trichonephila clavipes]|nr:uncharacterized protein TNCV_52071 [Trichonephila clavipes]